MEPVVSFSTSFMGSWVLPNEMLTGRSTSSSRSMVRERRGRRLVNSGGSGRVVLRSGLRLGRRGGDHAPSVCGLSANQRVRQVRFAKRQRDRGPFLATSLRAPLGAGFARDFVPENGRSERAMLPKRLAQNLEPGVAGLAGLDGFRALPPSE